MKAGTFKRLTHRFQGGKNGLPKLTLHKKVLAAVTKIVADNSAGQTAKKQAQKERKAEKKAAEVRAAAAVAAAGTESSEDDSGTDEDDPLTPVILSQATRVGRTPGYNVMPTQTAPQAQRQQCSYSTTRGVRSSAVTANTVGEEAHAPQGTLQGWPRMAITSARLARVRATLLGATVRRLQARLRQAAQSTLRSMISGTRQDKLCSSKPA